MKPACRTDVRYEAFWAIVVLALVALAPFAIRYAAKEFAAAQVEQYRIEERLADWVEL